MLDLKQLLSEEVDGTGELDELLASKADEPLTLEEIRAQRLSFVMGMLPRETTLTREDVRQLLEKRYG